MVGASGAQGGGGFDNLGSTSETSHGPGALSPPNQNPGSQRDLGLHLDLEILHPPSAGLSFLICKMGTISFLLIKTRVKD